MTILIQSRNDIEETQMTVDTIRSLLDVENVSVVVLDDSDTAGLREWAKEQEDLTYVLFDEESVSFGEAFRQIYQEIDISDDLLLLAGGALITPFFLSRLQDALYSDDALFAVGGTPATCFEDVTDYRSAAIKGQSLLGNPTKYVLAPDTDAILFRKEGIAKLGFPDERFDGREGALNDYIVTGILADYRFATAEHALYYRTGNPQEVTDGDMEAMRDKWGTHYFNLRPVTNLLSLIRCNQSDEVNILEIGCDCGSTLLELQNVYPLSRTYGCELNPVAARIASHVCQVTIANIEEEPKLFEGTKFDYVIFGDVLEHLHNPQRTIEYCHTLLKEDGCIIASVPNLMHISVMEQLLNGFFTYTETGLLDKTHIHFFTYYEVLRMFDTAGYAVEQMAYTFIPMNEGQRKLTAELMKLTTHAEPMMFETFQYILRARRKR